MAMAQAAGKDLQSDAVWHRNGDVWTAALGPALLRTAFQPLFVFENERLVPVAAEALVRPLVAGRPATPGRLFRGLSTEGLVRLEAALRRLHVLNAACLPAGARRLFVNLHPKAIVSQSALEQALDTMGADLRTAGLSPRDLVVEITEQQETSREMLLHAVWAMRARGFLVAVDDFGTAFADPDRVRRLVPDIVKVEGAAVRAMMRTPEGFSILCRTIDNFAASGIRTVLEGIETMRQVELAHLAGPVVLQGYALARPHLVPLGNAPWTARPPAPVEDGMRKRFA